MGGVAPIHGEAQTQRRVEPMNARSHGFIALLVLVLSQMPASAADRGWDPLEGISSLVAWFKTLNAEFDQIADQEKQGQLLRSVDRLRRDLYRLEVDTRFLLESIPTEPPTESELQHIGNYADDLLQTVEELSEHVREVGADLRLQDRDAGDEVEWKLTSGLRTRGVVLTYVQDKLVEAARDPTSWEPQAVRAKLQIGLAAVKEAQVAVTGFQRRLQSMDRDF